MNRRVGWSLLVLLSAWIVSAIVVNPCGEFLINDDWSYVRALQRLLEGPGLDTTGWGPPGAPAGPSAILHLLWGGLFVQVFGWSLTVLRFAVLGAGVAASLMFFLFLRSRGTSQPLALCAAFTLVFNPLFFALAFTFMTDVTFVALSIGAIAFMVTGVDRGRTSYAVIGLLLAGAATLVRDFGLLLAVGFVITCVVHPRGKGLGPLSVLAWAAGVCLLPWLCWEAVLFQIGSTFWQHQAWQNIFGNQDTATVVFRVLKGVALRLPWIVGYVSLFTLPVLAATWDGRLTSPWVRWIVAGWTVVFLALEGAILTNLISPKTAFVGNIFIESGIGPITLKDMHILPASTRGIVIGPAIFYALVYAAGLGALRLMGVVVRTVKALPRCKEMSPQDCPDFLALYALVVSVLYGGVLCIIGGFVDRYLIPLCMLVILWVISASRSLADEQVPRPGDLPWWGRMRWLLASAMLGLFALFSVGGTHDFMSLKRSVAQAHHYLLTEMAVNPCDGDGGFEFNGWHCYRNDFRPKPGMSWWWVDRETFVVTLCPLPGFRTVRSFPFRRILAFDGQVVVLVPDAEPPNTAGEK